MSVRLERSSARAALLSFFLVVINTGCGGGSGGSTQNSPPPAPAQSLDLLDVTPTDGLIRVFGAAGPGTFGVPVAGGFDCDGDGAIDYAMAAMRASPFGRSFAGEVYLVFGDGSINDEIDTAIETDRFLTITGAGPSEAAGDEIWIDDVTGDGIGDLLIGRQNFRASNPDRIGAGALTIVSGGAELRNLVANSEVLDLANPSPSATVLTLLGAAELDRLGIWMRTGDITGDGISDIAVSADQEDGGGETNRGAVYVLRGGAHLATSAVVDLAGFGATALAGHLARVTPPSGADGYHLGATVAIADLDGNGRSELLAAAALSRSGASIQADGAPAGSAERTGGTANGTLFIAWDDAFGAGPTWDPGFEFVLDDTAPGTLTVVAGGAVPGVFENRFFGEEILGGLDYDGDGEVDLFVGDIRGTARADRLTAGVGHVFFRAATLKDLTFATDALPPNVSMTTILGPESSAIAADTSLHGDFDGDGLADLAIAAPTASPLGRQGAGSLHVLWGKAGTWPTVVDLRTDLQPDPAELQITDILGGRGATSTDAGDTLAYSAAPGDLDGDGRTDLILNEMLGNGIGANAVDTGNLIVIDGALVAQLK